MNRLNTSTNLIQHDDLYEQIVGLHEGLSLEESLKVTAKFSLLLANHIGDTQVILDAIDVVTSQTETEKVKR